MNEALPVDADDDAIAEALRKILEESKQTSIDSDLRMAQIQAWI